MNHLNYFHKQMARTLKKKIPLLWRQEWVPRRTGKHVGKLMPHFHLLVFGIRFIHHRDINLWWRKAINYDEAPLATDVEKVTGEDGAIRYVAKYLAKNPSLDIRSYLDNKFTMGRFWGVREKSSIEMHPTTIIQLDDSLQVEHAMKEGSRILRKPPTWIDGGFTLLGHAGKALMTELGKTC